MTQPDKVKDLAQRMKIAKSWGKRITAMMKMEHFCKLSREHHTQMFRWVNSQVAPGWRIIRRVEKEIEKAQKKMGAK